MAGAGALARPERMADRGHAGMRAERILIEPLAAG